MNETLEEKIKRIGNSLQIELSKYDIEIILVNMEGLTDKEKNDEGTIASFVDDFDEFHNDYFGG